MPNKKHEPKHVDDVNEAVAVVTDSVSTLGTPYPELDALLSSGIVSYDGNNDQVWREGHLEHVARIYAVSPAQAERDYHDELAVAKVACWERFEALVMEASGQ